MEVNFCALDRGMAKKLFDGVEIRAGDQEVRAKVVTEGVRGEQLAEPNLLAQFLEGPLNFAAGDGFVVFPWEERGIWSD